MGPCQEIIQVDEVVVRTIEVAVAITKLSPESVIVTRARIREGWESGSVDRATAATAERYRHKLFSGENIKGGELEGRPTRKESLLIVRVI